jgi:hypothetical protein
LQARKTKLGADSTQTKYATPRHATVARQPFQHAAHKFQHRAGSRKFDKKSLQNPELRGTAAQRGRMLANIRHTTARGKKDDDQETLHRPSPDSRKLPNFRHNSYFTITHVVKSFGQLKRHLSDILKMNIAKLCFCGKRILRVSYLQTVEV